MTSFAPLFSKPCLTFTTAFGNTAKPSGAVRLLAGHVLRRNATGGERMTGVVCSGSFLWVVPTLILRVEIFSRFLLLIMRVSNPAELPFHLATAEFHMVKNVSVSSFKQFVWFRGM